MLVVMMVRRGGELTREVRCWAWLLGSGVVDLDDVEDGLAADGTALLVLPELLRAVMARRQVAALVEDDVPLLAQADHAQRLVYET
jgi:hypothetical protein